MKRSVVTPVTVLDLFAGCGGFTQGFHSFVPEEPGRERRVSDGPAVFRSVGAVEWDKAAAKTYELNFGHAAVVSRTDTSMTSESPQVHCEDIAKWEPNDLERTAEVIVGGPPCQGFSGLNRSGIGAERNKLWQHFIRTVVVVQPKVFVIENVDRFVRSPEFSDLISRIGDGNLRNYRLVDPIGTTSDKNANSWASRYVLNAADYGAPQARRRAIVIGVRTDIDHTDREPLSYPVPRYSREALVANNRDEGPHNADSRIPELPWMTVAPIFAKTAKLSLVDVDGDREVPRTSLPDGGPYKTRDLHVTRNPEVLSRARYRAIPAAGNRTDLQGKYFYLDGSDIRIVEDEGDRLRLIAEGIDCVPLSTPSWDSHKSGSGDVMGRLRIDRPSVTIRTEFFKPEKGRYLHPTEDRPITHYEAALIQGFPESFSWYGSKTEIARQIGNAVPIPLGRAIAGSIYAYLRRP